MRTLDLSPSEISAPTAFSMLSMCRQGMLDLVGLSKIASSVRRCFPFIVTAIVSSDDTARQVEKNAGKRLRYAVHQAAHIREPPRAPQAAFVHGTLPYC